MKNVASKQGADAVGKPVEPVASAARYEVFLHQFGEAAVGNADDDGEEQGSFLVGLALRGISLTVAPQTKEGKGGIHQHVRHLVESDDGLAVGP